MCSGRVSPEMVLRAFRSGADGVLVLGCHIGECHYINGNHRTAKRIPVLRNLLSYVGINPDRLRLDWVSAAEAPRLPQVTRRVCRDGARAGTARRTGGAGMIDADPCPRGRNYSKNWMASLPCSSTSAGTAPCSVQGGRRRHQLVLEPRYPLSPDRLAAAQAVSRGQASASWPARCDMRALVEMAKRQQVDPERLHIVAVACSEEDVQDLLLLRAMPRIEDWPQAEVIGTPAESTPPNPIVAEYDEMSLEERQAFWQQQFLKCIKCYGCRNICPECFCEACALEDPLVGRTGHAGPTLPHVPPDPGHAHEPAAASPAGSASWPARPTSR